jgi:hypothetical protein
MRLSHSRESEQWTNLCICETFMLKEMAYTFHHQKNIHQSFLSMLQDLLGDNYILEENASQIQIPTTTIEMQWGKYHKC